MEKGVVKLKKDDLINTQVTALVDEHLDSRLGATRDEFKSYLSASITARITEQVKIQLPQILPKEAKDSSQPQSTYEAASSLTKIELKKILIDKMDESQSYLTAAKHRECYDGLIKFYDLDKSLFSTYDKVYSLKKSRKDKDKDEDSSAGSDRGLKKWKTIKDAEPTKEEPEFEVADSDMPQDQKENLGNNDEEPKRKTLEQGPTQSWFMTLASSADKLLKTFDELMSTHIDFSAYIMNGLKITNLTQETLFGPAFKLLKGTRTNFAELEYDFEECYKALSKNLDWDNPEVMNGDCQMVPVDYFFNNDLKYLQGGILTMTNTTSTTKTKATQYDLQGIEDMVPNIWSPVKVAYDKYALWGDFPRLRINDIKDMMILIVQNRLTNLSGNDVSDFAISLRMPETTRPNIKKRDTYTPYQDPQGFIYVDNQGRNRLMRSDELYKFSDGTLTRLQTLLDDSQRISKWSTCHIEDGVHWKRK
ncbi:hypothetical protein Tco_1282737 [Tanacetum coccineum]